MSRLTVYGAFLLPDKCILCGKPATITHGHAPAVSLDTLQSSGGSFAFKGIDMSAKNGKPCKKCGTSEWDRFGGCLRCKSVRTRKWQKEHPERHAANRDKYEKANPDRIQKWRKANPEKCNAQSRKWRAANPEKFSESVRKSAQASPDAVKARNHRRRTLKTAAGGSYTAAEWRDLVEHYGNKCLCCGRADVKLTVDHIIPVAKGGTSNIENIQPLCQTCNTRKKDKTIDYRPQTGIGRWIQRKLFG